MNLVIIDDEPNCTDVLKLLIERMYPSIFNIIVFNDPQKALTYLIDHDVELIFLDIEMPILNGFELLRRVEKKSFKVVFTTAYDQYAIKAFKFNAIDYLLKPIDKQELKGALERFESMIPINQNQLSFVKYLQQHPVPEKIMLPIGNELILVNVNKIICCEADGSYCRIYIEGKEKPYMLSKILRDIEELLDNKRFFRSHHSWLINEDYVTKIIKGEMMEVILNESMSVPVARAKKQEVLDRIMKWKYRNE